ncbi:hypothetical protein [Fibrella aquatilis]|uniref:Uncharacterized protein n=1 Tax=Fibrella aquatilis TaxID=2817059 RepID=A0A939GAI6_9BACT|nr:hypothetical protein [Fibrella aquatilis]MBO0933315.1 hypothetical protein [Fibrella aquatilis]
MQGRFLIYLFLPFVSLETYEKQTRPVDRAVRTISYLIRTPFHAFLVYAIAAPIAGRHADTINVGFIALVLIVIFEFVTSKYLRIDHLIEKKFDEYNSQSQAEGFYQKDSKKAVAISWIAIVLFFLWAFISLISIIFFIKR